jgi:hypothetical protein
VLAVGIKRYQHVEALRQRVINACLQRRALAEIDRMSDDTRTACQSI